MVFAIPGVPGSVDFGNNGADTKNVFWLFREKVHLGFIPCSWFNIFAEGRDSSTINDDRKPGPETDRFDLHQGFVLLGDAKQFPLTAKVGRQELSYGDERLIGAFDWNNVGRVFDAAKLRWQNEKSWVDGFAGRVVIPNDHEFNVANDYDWFWGAYASTKALCPKLVTDFYFLGRNTGRPSPNAIGTGLPAFQQGATARDIYTVGLRFKSLPDAWGGWDCDGDKGEKRDAGSAGEASGASPITAAEPPPSSSRCGCRTAGADGDPTASAYWLLVASGVLAAALVCARRARGSVR